MQINDQITDHKHRKIYNLSEEGLFDRRDLKNSEETKN